MVTCVHIAVLVLLFAKNRSSRLQGGGCARAQNVAGYLTVVSRSHSLLRLIIAQGTREVSFQTHELASPFGVTCKFRVQTCFLSYIALDGGVFFFTAWGEFIKRTVLPEFIMLDGSTQIKRCRKPEIFFDPTGVWCGMRSTFLT